MNSRVMAVDDVRDEDVDNRSSPKKEGQSLIRHAGGGGEGDGDGDGDVFYDVVESLMRVSIAGFGGALAGLSLAQKRRPPPGMMRGGGRLVRGVSAKSSSKAKPLEEAKMMMPPPPPSPSNSNLPTAWAIACMAFAGMVETSRRISPCAHLLPSDLGMPRSARTVGDLTLGGAVAGAAFRGMQIQAIGTTTTPSKIAPALTPRILSGLGPGILLGLLAGILQAASDYVDDEVEKRHQQQKQQSPRRPDQEQDSTTAEKGDFVGELNLESIEIHNEEPMEPMDSRQQA